MMPAEVKSAVARRHEDVIDLRTEPAVIELADPKPSHLDLDPDHYRSLVAACQSVRHSPMTTRVFDLACGIPLLIVAAPLIGAITLLMRVTTRGPVFFASQRFARDDGTFGAWKFRTMVDELEQQRILEADPILAEQLERECKLLSDPRVTRIGRFLRKSSLDELPQLWNVVRGDMSLVGPRPKTLEEASRYGTAIEPILSIRPGLTGLWQTSGRNDLPFEDRIMLDLEYVANRSVLGDVRLCLTTMRQVISSDRHGAY